AVFLGTGLLFVLFQERLRRVHQQARAALATSRQANDRLQTVLDERLIFSALIENSSDFIGIADPNGKGLYLNPAGRRMVGLSHDHPVGDTHILEYYPPEWRAFMSDVIMKDTLEE